ncbi:3' exoribonuclease family domain [Trypanosoma vivax]|uniref:Exosome complex exonuclease n=1 Tax=Trypanosoma vivax (strain Y486) TaxID=1055687 RepID=G0TW88_TRYVY|nr:exosome complex exonuclease [Trypanosoma vivax]KAH8619688.1 3' exoribonuclease family domain [Trypanosoma vivax]CCC48226.1 exosome complex exonuclease [Trypanosoma vivax Y486]
MHNQQRTAQTIASPALSQREVEFTKSSWLVGLRPDQRTAQQLRDVVVEFPLVTRDVVVVRCGGTVISGAIASNLVEPMPQRPKHGLLHFSVRLLQTERESPTATALTQTKLAAFLDRLIRTGGVLDTAALCVLPGERVWSITIDVTVLNDEGNSSDAVVWAAIALLLHHRRPELTIRGNSITVHPPHEREPVPLSVHHTPLPFTFAVTMSLEEYERTRRSITASHQHVHSAGGNSMPSQALCVVVDPTTSEALAAASTIVVAINAEGQVCALSKSEGCCVQVAELNQCIEIASILAPRVLGIIHAAMEAHDGKRQMALKEQFAWAQKRNAVGRVEPESTKQLKTEV